MTKYHSVEKVCNHGHLHQSTKEKNRCNELYLLLHSGQIKGLGQQIRFELLKTFKYNGETIRGIKYYADFVYYDTKLKKTVIEDVKGMRSPVYQLKRKLMLNLFKDNADYLFMET
jgi:hypothetical protein